MTIDPSTLLLFPALARTATLPGWSYLLFAMVFLGVLLVRRMRDNERTSELGSIAVQLGLRMESAILPRTEEGLKALPLFAARGRKFSNVMLGYAAGGEVMLFDFSYSSGDSVKRQTVAAFYWPGAASPAFQLRPENAVHRIIQKLGYQDIDFEGFPEFSRRYLLRGHDEAAVRSFFATNKLAFMETRPASERFSVEAAGRWLAVFSAGTTVPADGLRGFLDEATAVSSALCGTSAKRAFSSTGN
jgi:hypothetical protein